MIALRALSAGLGNRVWQLASYFEYRRFRDQTHCLRPIQEQRLTAELARLEATVWGRRHGVSRDWTYQRFRDEVPLHSYEDLLPFLQLENGLTQESVRVWEPTGGSTGGCKWVPWTRSLQGQFHGAVSAWIFDFYSRYPEARNGRSYWQLTPAAQLEAPSWIGQERAGFESDGDYLGAVGTLLERAVLLQVDKEGSDFWLGTVRALTSCSDLRVLSCWSPSFLLVLRAKCEEFLGSWRPARWWPKLQVVSCWTHGPASSLLETVREFFPGVTIQGKGLLSTEAVTTIPFLGTYPLAYRSHFFEFLADSGRVYPSWELDLGGAYEVLQTTGNGFVRYRSGDRVKVTGFLGQVPCLEFVGREAVSDHFGEKLSHHYLDSVLSEWVGFAGLGFEERGYILFLELKSHSSVESARSFWRDVKAKLNQVYSYRDCRRLEQLSELRCFGVSGDAWEQMLSFWGERCAREKPSKVLPPGHWSQRFQGGFLSENNWHE